MARKEKYITIEAENRDKGKMFFIQEMAADKAERWGIRAISALVAAGAEIPENIQGMGMAALAAEGVKSFAKVPFDVSEPLLNELLGCVQIVPDPTKKDIKRSDIRRDIEEASTYIRLRVEAFKLHLDFFGVAGD